jgi:hypothetical protein
MKLLVFLLLGKYGRRRRGRAGKKISDGLDVGVGLLYSRLVYLNSVSETTAGL